MNLSIINVNVEMIINFWTYILIDLNLELFVKLIVILAIKTYQKDSEKKKG